MVQSVKIIVIAFICLSASCIGSKKTQDIKIWDMKAIYMEFGDQMAEGIEGELADINGRKVLVETKNFIDSINKVAYVCKDIRDYYMAVNSTASSYSERFYQLYAMTDNKVLMLIAYWEKDPADVLHDHKPALSGYIFDKKDETFTKSSLSEFIPPLKEEDFIVTDETMGRRGKGRFRFNIFGVQDKLAVFLDGSGVEGFQSVRTRQRWLVWTDQHGFILAEE